MKFQTISVKELERYIEQGELELVDLRSPEEYEAYHLEGAINIPYDELEDISGKLSRQKGYILYCERGSSSLLAAKELSQKGFRIYTVMGGIRAVEELESI